MTLRYELITKAQQLPTKYGRRRPLFVVVEEAKFKALEAELGDGSQFSVDSETFDYPRWVDNTTHCPIDFSFCGTPLHIDSVLGASRPNDQCIWFKLDTLPYPNLCAYYEGLNSSYGPDIIVTWSCDGRAPLADKQLPHFGIDETGSMELTTDEIYNEVASYCLDEKWRAPNIDA